MVHIKLACLQLKEFFHPLCVVVVKTLRCSILSQFLLGERPLSAWMFVGLALAGFKFTGPRGVRGPLLGEMLFLLHGLGHILAFLFGLLLFPIPHVSCICLSELVHGWVDVLFLYLHAPLHRLNGVCSSGGLPGVNWFQLVLLVQTVSDKFTFNVGRWEHQLLLDSGE